MSRVKMFVSLSEIIQSFIYLHLLCSVGSRGFAKYLVYIIGCRGTRPYTASTFKTIDRLQMTSVLIWTLESGI